MSLLDSPRPHTVLNFYKLVSVKYELAQRHYKSKTFRYEPHELCETVLQATEDLDLVNSNEWYCTSLHGKAIMDAEVPWDSWWPTTKTKCYWWRKNYYVENDGIWELQVVRKSKVNGTCSLDITNISQPPFYAGPENCNYKPSLTNGNPCFRPIE